MANQDTISPKYENVREPAVAGAFYPGGPKELEAAASGLIERAAAGTSSKKVKAIMAPHAGYAYSGPVAGRAYRQIKGKEYDTVFLLCNAHSEYFAGVAVDGSDAWQTPLGLVQLDQGKIKELIDFDPVIKSNSQAHSSDHTLEVQLPFLQTALNNEFKIVPILFGQTTDQAHKILAQAIKEAAGPNDLIVVSTDLSHYPQHEDARKIDKQTLAIAEKGDIEALEEHIRQTEAANIKNEQTLCCGIDAVKTMMRLAREQGWPAEVLGYNSSGDTAGDKSRVVGYGALAWRSDESEQSGQNELSREQKKELIEIARASVEAHVQGRPRPEFDIEDKRLNWQEGAFVTLHKNGELRGCIGQIIPTDKPLWQVVGDMGVSACSEDHRFPPVKPDELDKLDYEVSVLSVPEPIDDWQKIELGKHGVIVRQGYRSGVFLPQVADETGWSREEFLSQLCWQKAGLPPNCYKDRQTGLEIFTAQVFGEQDI